MNRPLNDAATAALLADAMRDEVAAVVPPPTIVSGLAERAARRRRARVTALGAVACVVAVAGVLSVTRPGPAPAPPDRLPVVASPSASESPGPVFVPPPRMEAAALPPGFMYWNTEPVSTRPTDGSMVWPRVVTYARGFTYAGKPRTPISVLTTVDAINEIDAEDFDDPDARWVTVGDRRVVYATAAGGTRGYHWTEGRGVNVSVTAGAGVTDAELRHVVADVRLVSPPPATVPGTLTRLDADSGTGVLHVVTRGRGSRTIGPIAVPAEFDVTIVCDGGSLRIEIGSMWDTTYGCTDGDTPSTHIVDRTGGIRSVTITLTADQSTTWALLVTTSGGRPRP